MAPLRNLFGAVLPLNSNFNGCPKGEASLLSDGNLLDMAKIGVVERVCVCVCDGQQRIRYGVQVLEWLLSMYDFYIPFHRLACCIYKT